MRFLTVIATIFAALPGWASDYYRPIPQAQSATAEFWFLIAAVALVFALLVVGLLVRRK